MEVHPPEHGIHTWRDFLVHMGTITLGLLIALGMEAAVERWHHHSELVEARERIREELAENRKTIADDRRLMATLRDQTAADIRLLDAPGPVDGGKLFFGWTWNSPESGAYEAARTTGVLALMPYAEAQRLGEIYGQQETINQAARDLVKERAHLIGPLLRRSSLQNGRVSGDLTTEQRAALADNCGESLTQIALMLDLTSGMDRRYAEVAAGR